MTLVVLSYHETLFLVHLPVAFVDYVQKMNSPLQFWLNHLNLWIAYDNYLCCELVIADKAPFMVRKICITKIMSVEIIFDKMHMNVINVYMCF